MYEALSASYQEFNLINLFKTVLFFNLVDVKNSTRFIEFCIILNGILRKNESNDIFEDLFLFNFYQKVNPKETRRKK
jgi:hypothetical protein